MFIEMYHILFIRIFHLSEEKPPVCERFDLTFLERKIVEADVGEGGGQRQAYQRHQQPQR